MPGQYRFVRAGSEPEQVCVSFEELLAKIAAFGKTNTDPHVELRVYDPLATDDEHKQIDAAIAAAKLQLRRKF